MNYYYIQDAYNSKVIALSHVSTTQQAIDIFTKSLTRQQIDACGLTDINLRGGYQGIIRSLLFTYN